MTTGARRRATAWAIAGLAAALGCAHTPVPDCQPEGPARPICGFTNPEDLVPLPGDGALLAGEYGRDAEHHSGGLVLLDLETEQVRRVYRGGEGPARWEAGWGAPGCTAPPSAAFNSHGLDLVRRDDGRLALLAVQHGGREAVEIFEVSGAGGDWAVEWRGCVPAPASASLNDVAALPDGSFFTTKMYDLSERPDFSQGMPTTPTGYALLWSPADGYTKVGGSDGVIPNGIAASPDGRLVYMNVAGGDHVRKIEVATGRELGRARVPAPDNVTWSPDGVLLVASARPGGPDDFAACGRVVQGPCRLPFAIVAVDPDTMQALGPVYESSGTPMGAGTVGLQIGRELFIGSFQGDRILRVDLDAVAAGGPAAP